MQNATASSNFGWGCNRVIALEPSPCYDRGLNFTRVFLHILTVHCVVSCIAYIVSRLQ